MFHLDTKSQVREDEKQSRHVESSHNMWSGAIIKVASDLKYSVSHLIQTPGDHGNLFLLRGVLIKVI